MTRSFLCLTLVLLLAGLPCNANDDKVISVSTSGVELDENITETIKPSKEQKKEEKAKENKRKVYFKTQNKLKKLSIQKEKQLKELEFLKHRLEIKEQKLEEYTSDNNEKGEKE